MDSFPLHHTYARGARGNCARGSPLSRPPRKHPPSSACARTHGAGCALRTVPEPASGRAATSLAGFEKAAALRLPRPASLFPEEEERDGRCEPCWSSRRRHRGRVIANRGRRRRVRARNVVRPCDQAPNRIRTRLINNNSTRRFR